MILQPCSPVAGDGRVLENWQSAQESDRVYQCNLEGTGIYL